MRAGGWERGLRAGCRCQPPAGTMAREQQRCLRQHTHATGLFLASSCGSKHVLKHLLELVAPAPGSARGCCRREVVEVSAAPLSQLVTLLFCCFFPPPRPFLVSLPSPLPLPPFPVVGMFIGLLKSWQWKHKWSANELLPPCLLRGSLLAQVTSVLSWLRCWLRWKPRKAPSMCVSTRPVHIHCLPGGKKVAVVDIYSVWYCNPSRNWREAQQDERWDTGDLRGAHCAYKIIRQVAELKIFCMFNTKIFTASPTVLSLTLQQDFYHLSQFQVCINSNIKLELGQCLGITYLSRISHWILVDFRASNAWASCLPCH